MSRELKFRAWLNPTQEYINDWLDCYGKEPPRIMCWYYTEESLFDDTWLNTDDYKSIDVEQYTGFKDKNGKEIYEGDIVRLQLPEDGPQNQSFVGYGCGGWKEDKHFGEHEHRYLDLRIVWDSERAMFMDVGTDDDKGEPLAWLNRCCCEVIGNIHEEAK